MTKHMPYELRRFLGFLLVPLSLVPFVLMMPLILHQERVFQRSHGPRGVLAYPTTVRIAPAQLARWVPLAPLRSAVPVLAYHGIGPAGGDPASGAGESAGDIYTVTQADFARQMAMLDAAGFQPISPAQEVAFLHGDKRALPARPILITFDDGRLDSYRGADAVLARHHFRATMFVITGPVDANHAFHLHWSELRKMQASGRWDLQEHAADGHRQIVVDAAGHTGPFFANLMYANGRLETIDQFRERVNGDLAKGHADLKREIPGLRSQTFAVPYGNFGQNKSNDKRIAPLMRAILKRDFAATFTQNEAAYTTRATPSTDLQRFEVHGDTTADQLYGWLRSTRPVAPRASHPAPRHHAKHHGGN